MYIFKKGKSGSWISDFEDFGQLYLSKWKYAKSSVNKGKESNNHKNFDHSVAIDGKILYTLKESMNTRPML